jgi:hypothetical protein
VSWTKGVTSAALRRVTSVSMELVQQPMAVRWRGSVGLLYVHRLLHTCHRVVQGALLLHTCYYKCCLAPLSEARGTQ